MSRSTRVLIVDDSSTARRGLSRALTDTSSDIIVVGEAASRQETLAAIERLAPDIVTMDVHLGDDDGVDLTAHIMSTKPLPILIVTGVNPRDPGLIFRAMQAGALDVLPKLPGPFDRLYASERKRLVLAVKALSTVPVVTRRTLHAQGTPSTIPPPQKGQSSDKLVARTSDIPDIVLLGASTGGPPALETLLCGIPKPFPLPIIIVQHTSESFVSMFASWLRASTGHRILVAPTTCSPAPGDVIVAPGNAHLMFTTRGVLSIQEGPPRNFHRPCIDILFESAAEHYGAAALAVLMTGMGTDGARGMLALRRAGATTIAQDPSTCIVDSMPRSAVEVGATSAVLTIDRIASRLASYAIGIR